MAAESWRRLARGASRRNAPWLHRQPVVISRGVAIAAVLGLFLVVWGPSLLAVGWFYATGEVSPGAGWRQSSGGIAGDITWAVLLVVVVLLVARLLTGGWGARPARTLADVRREAVGGGIYVLFAGASLGVLMSLIAWVTHTAGDYPRTPSPTAGSVTWDLVSSVLAGPTEEMFFCVFVVVVLRSAGMRLWSVVAISTLLRLTFHAYYGPAVLGMSLWAAGVVVVYLVSGRVLGLIVAHSTWDVGVTATDQGWPLLQVVTFVVTYVLVFAAVATAVARLRPWVSRLWWRRRASSSSDLGSS